jgi:hypothetical protein
MCVLNGGMIHLFNVFVGSRILKMKPDFLIIKDWKKAGMVHKVKVLLTKGMTWNKFVDLGGAVQVDPIKPKLEPPGTKRLKLGYERLL